MTGSAAVTLNGGTLASGASALIAGTVAAGSGTHWIDPGAVGPAGIGALTVGGLALNANTQMLFSIAGTSSLDQILDNGSLSFAASSNQATLLVPGGLAGGTYELLSFASDPAVTASNFQLAASGTGSIAGYQVSLTAGQLDLVVPGVVTGPSIWASAVGGSWNTAGNWQNGTVPNAVGAVAQINAPTPTGLTITLDAPQTVGTLQLGNTANASVGYTLTGSGSNTLTLNNSGSGATIAVANGTHAIDAPVVLADNLVVSGSGTLVFGSASTISGSYSLTMSGVGGSLVLSGSDSFTGATTVTAGTLTLASSAALPVGTSLTVGTGGVFNFALAAMLAGGDSSAASSLQAADEAVAGGEPRAASPAAGVEAVPEPGTIVLLLAALCSAAVYCRFSRRRATKV